MRTTYILIVTLIVFSFTAQAQLNPGLLYSGHFRTAGSKYIPSKLGEDFDKTEITVFLSPLHVSVSNTAFSGLDIIDFATDDVITDTEIDDVVDGLSESNKLHYNFNWTPLSFSWWIKRRTKVTDGTDEVSEPQKLAAFQISTSINALSSIEFGENLFRTVFQGNKQFAGQTVPLGPFNVNAIGYADITLGVSVPLSMLDLQLRGMPVLLKPGFRFKYMLPLGAAIRTERSDMSLFTEQQGKYLDFTYDYLINTSLPTGDENDILLGNGFGFDLGLQADFDDNITASVSFIDMGRFNLNSANDTTYSRTGTIRYEGSDVDVVQLVSDNSTELSFTEELEDIFDPDRSAESYSMPLGAKMIAQVEYRMARYTISKTGEKYYRHNMFFTYMQGFKTHLGATTRPSLGLAYTFNLRNKINIGGSATFLGYNKTAALGMHASAQAGPMKIGLSIDNMLVVVGSNFGIGLNLTWAIR